MKPPSSSGQHLASTKTIMRSEVLSLMEAHKTSLNDTICNLQCALSEATSKLSDVIESLEFTQKELEDLKKEIRKLSDDNAVLEQQLRGLSADTAEVKQSLMKATDRADYMEDQSRKYNLCISGIPEDKNENWQQSHWKVSQFLRRHINLTPDLERAHRVGKQKDKPRDIVVKFTRFQNRESVLQDRRMLAGTRVYVNEDLCPATLDIRRTSYSFPPAVPPNTPAVDVNLTSTDQTTSAPADASPTPASGATSQAPPSHEMLQPEITANSIAPAATDIQVTSEARPTPSSPSKAVRMRKPPSYYKA
ncbi:uncharacterized protein [Penaeus vannamei]|uniref:uncharacterized protein n=1 Tax=Penaeus vannamei TaxID=6689 RepID=UPI00387F58D0